MVLYKIAKADLLLVFQFYLGPSILIAKKKKKNFSPG